MELISRKKEIKKGDIFKLFDYFNSFNSSIGTPALTVFIQENTSIFDELVKENKKEFKYLSKEESLLVKEYEDKEGYKFPFIHYLANFIIKEKVSYFKYCNLALYFRGMIWGLFLYLALVLFDYLSYLEYIIISIIYGIGFPFACYLSRKKSFNYKSKFISIVGKWETQEIYYGFIHFICNTYIIFKFF